MGPKDLEKLLAKYLEGTCTQDEQKLVESIYSSLGAQPKGNVDSPMEARAASAEQRILDAVRRHAHQDTGRHPATQRTFFWRYTGIAASVVLCVVAGYYFTLSSDYSDLPVAQTSQSDFSNISNTTALPRRLMLPDGSIVQLATGGTVRFANSNKISLRELYLEGEAYFDIARDPARPFYVYAGDIVTKVLGTSFIVRAPADDKVTVSVKTGKVTVYSRKASHKKTVLTPNQEAIYDQLTDVVATQEVPPARLKEESMGFIAMHFDETPVSEVLTQLTKAYDIDIIFKKEDLSGCVLTSGFFEEGLYDRIDVICTAIGATYTIEDARIIIESKGCNLKPD